MTNDIIQVDYKKLESIAMRFGAEAQANKNLYHRLLRAEQLLQEGGWQGKGSQAFFAEMEGTVFPAMIRLTNSLEQARDVTMQIKSILQEAEQEAARPFRGKNADLRSANSKLSSQTDSFTEQLPINPEMLHTVQEEDSWLSLAVKNNMSVWELKALNPHVGMLFPGQTIRLTPVVYLENLANLPKTNQYELRSLENGASTYGWNACGLVAGTTRDFKPGTSGYLATIATLRNYAGDAYGINTGIQPKPYTESLKQHYGSQHVTAHNRWDVSGIYNELTQGHTVIVDIHVQRGIEVPGRISDPETYAHFTRVVGLDLESGRVYLENTLSSNGSYWTLSTEEFEAAWELPETKADYPVEGAEDVTNWAAVIDRNARRIIPDPFP